MKRLISLAILLVLAACSETRQEQLTFAPTLLDFGEQPVGEVTTRTLSVTNAGKSTVTLELRTDPPFTVSYERATLAPGARLDVPFSFAPVAEGQAASAFAIRTSTRQYQGTLTGVGAGTSACGTPLPCQVFAHDVDGGCATRFAPEGTACSVNCAPNGVCHEGSCEGFNPACDDGNRCTVDGCGPGGCIQTPRVCPVPESACQVATCTPANGCGTVALADGTACGGSGCGTTKFCSAGECVLPQSTTPNCSLSLCSTPLDSCDAGDCAENPRPYTGIAISGFALGPKSVFFVTDQQELLRWDGAEMRSQGRFLGAQSVTGTAADDLWIGSTTENLKRFDGEQWVAVPGTVGCSRVVSVGRDDVVCAGQGRIVRVTHGEKVVDLATEGNLRLVARGETVYALAPGGALRRLEGNLLSYLGTVNYPVDLAVDPQGNPVVSANGQLRRFVNGTSTTLFVPWQPYTLATLSTGLITTSDLGRFAVQTADGGWREQVLDVNAIAPFGEDGFVVVNDSDVWASSRVPGGLIHYDGVDWNRVGCGYLSDGASLGALAAGPSSGAFAASTQGTVLRRGVNRWELISTSSYNIYAASVVSEDEAWFVGANGYAFEWNGTSMVDRGTALASGYAMSSVFARSASDVYASAGPYLLHWDGTSWARVTNFPVSNFFFRAVVGDASAVYVAGYQSPGNAVWKLSGGTWTELPLGTLATQVDLNRLALSAGKLFALSFSSNGSLLEWNGTAWQQESFPTSGVNGLSAVGGRPVLTANYALWAKDATGWHSTPTPNLYLGAMAPLPSGELLVSSGVTIRRMRLP